jgi:hypothetical protein
MFINDNLKTATLAIANLATGGSIGTAATTVDIASTFNINQTTAAQVITLPSPTDATAGDRLVVNNIGTASFTIGGLLIPINSTSNFVWTGTAWVTDANVGRNMGAVVTLATMIVGNNTVTHNLNMPTGSFSSIDFTARNATGSEVSFRRVSASDTANALVVNSTVAIPTATTFYITPLA